LVEWNNLGVNTPSIAEGFFCSASRWVKHAYGRWRRAEILGYRS
jgi:hypothetical protein